MYFSIWSTQNITVKNHIKGEIYSTTISTKSDSNELKDHLAFRFGDRTDDALQKYLQFRICPNGCIKRFELPRRISMPTQI